MREREETKLLGTFFTALLIGVGFAVLFTRPIWSKDKERSREIGEKNQRLGLGFPRRHKGES